MFIDHAKIFIHAGNGGNGCVSFRREKYVPFGGPNGGNGGKGGDMYVTALRSMNTLYDFSHKVHFVGEDGSHGQGSNKHGRGAEDSYIYVPCGTVVYRYNEITQERHCIADVVYPDQTVCVARGGRGGRGNASFKSNTNTAPRIAEKGEPGEHGIFILELKLIAKVGLVGYPNAGKSTLLARITKAKPKIADYPFTTLTPNLGIVEYNDMRYAVADIPGIIDGAHEGIGLGLEFLRHVERTTVLVHLVDCNGYETRDAYKNFIAMNKELKCYSAALTKKTQVVAITKSDTTDEKTVQALSKKIARNKTVPVHHLCAISSVTGKGIDALLAVLDTLIRNEPEAPIVQPEAIEQVFTYETPFTVKKKGNEFYVTGKKVEKLAAMTMFNEEEAVRRFENILKKMGVEAALVHAGIKEGDMVVIGEQEFAYEPFN